MIDRCAIAVSLALTLGALTGTSASAQGTAVTYGYDALGRVVSVTYTNGATVTYSYDSAGNRTAVTVTSGAGCATWGSSVWGIGSSWCISGTAGAASGTMNGTASNPNDRVRSLASTTRTSQGSGAADNIVRYAEK